VYNFQFKRIPKQSFSNWFHFIFKICVNHIFTQEEEECFENLQ